MNEFMDLPDRITEPLFDEILKFCKFEKKAEQIQAEELEGN